MSGRGTTHVKRAWNVTAAQVTDLRGSPRPMWKARFSTPALGCRSMPLSASFGESDKVVTCRVRRTMCHVLLVTFGVQRRMARAFDLSKRPVGLAGRSHEMPACGSDGQLDRVKRKFRAAIVSKSFDCI